MGHPSLEMIVHILITLNENLKSERFKIHRSVDFIKFRNAEQLILREVKGFVGKTVFSDIVIRIFPTDIIITRVYRR